MISRRSASTSDSTLLRGTSFVRVDWAITSQYQRAERGPDDVYNCALSTDVARRGSTAVLEKAGKRGARMTTKAIDYLVCPFTPDLLERFRKHAPGGAQESTPIKFPEYFMAGLTV